MGLLRLFIFVLFTAGLLAMLSLLAYWREVQAAEARNYDVLQAVAHLQEEKLLDWRRERLADSRMCATGEIRDDFLRWIETGAPRLLAQVDWRLAHYCKSYGYGAAALVDDSGSLVTAAGPQADRHLEEEAFVLARRALVSPGPIGGPFYFCAYERRLHLDFACPIIDDGGTAIGVVLLHMDPEAPVLDFLEHWPSPSETAETMLAQRRGEEIVFVSALRHGEDGRLTRSARLAEEDLPVAQAFRGVTGRFDGRDYRGVPVVSDIRVIPETGWALVSKIDKAEVRDRITLASVASTMMLASGIVGMGVGVGLFYNRRQVGLLRSLLLAEEAKQESEALFRAVFDTVPVSIWVEDWADVRRMAAGLGGEDISDYDQWMAVHPEFVTEALERVKIERVNAQTLAMFGAEGPEVLLNSLETVFSTPDTLAGFAGELAALARGEDQYEAETALRKIDGTLIYVLLRMTLPQGAEGDGRVIVSLMDITRRRNAEAELLRHRDILEETVRVRTRELHASNAYNRGLLEATTDALATVDREGRITDANVASRLIAPESPESLVGRPFVECFEDEEAARALLRDAEETGCSENVRLVARGGLNKGRTVLYNAVRYGESEGSAGGVLVIGRDITDLEEAEKRMRDAERRQRLILDNMPVALLLTTGDASQTMLYQNPRFVDFFGYDIAEFGNVEGWWPLAYPDAAYREWVSREWNRRVAEAVEQRREIEPMEVDIQARDGSARRMIVYAAPVGSENLITFVDLTERRAAEREVEELNARLERRSAQLEASNKELEAFSYSVSHDLKSPLRAVDGYAGYLQEDYGHLLDEEGQRLLRVVRENAQRMGQLINDLLAFSRLNRRALEPKPLDTRELVRRVWEELEQAETHHHYEFRLGALPRVTADPGTLHQVFANLLQNARKFSAGKPQPLIEVSGTAADGEVVISIRDNGAGFDMRYADKLFQVFQRLHSASEFEGTGIGLALCQRIIHRHGGRIWAEAEPGVGAAFFVALPRDGKSLDRENQSNV